MRKLFGIVFLLITVFVLIGIVQAIFVQGWLAEASVTASAVRGAPMSPAGVFGTLLVMAAIPGLLAYWLLKK